MASSRVAIPASHLLEKNMEQRLKDLIEKVNTKSISELVIENNAFEQKADKGRLLVAWEFVESYYCDPFVNEELNLDALMPTERFMKASLLAWYEIKSLEVTCGSYCHRCHDA